VTNVGGNSERRRQAIVATAGKRWAAALNVGKSSVIGGRISVAGGEASINQSNQRQRDWWRLNQSVVAALTGCWRRQSMFVNGDVTCIVGAV
jgi:hypothetical protein